MRSWMVRYAAMAAAVVGVLGGFAAGAHANWEGSTQLISGPLGGGGPISYENGTCSATGSTFLGVQWDASTNRYYPEDEELQSAVFPLPTLPAGAYWVGANASGTVELSGSALPQALNVQFAMAGTSFGSCGSQGNVLPIASNGDFSGNGFSILEGLAGAESNGSDEANALIQPYDNASQYEATYLDTLYIQPQYAYIPTSIGWSQVYSGNGTQDTISWNANGNQSDIGYLLQRETLQGSSVTQGWTTIYQGGSTSFTTTDQVCGVGYIYRVSAYGQSGGTPADQSGEMDEYPCSVSASGATTTSVSVSWPQVTTATVPTIVWCEEDTPAGAVSCSQANFTLSAGDTSATITGLTPNAEYAVWACSDTNSWGCPSLTEWTTAATPVLNANNDTSGLPYNSQLLTWTTAGNASGTTYVLEQGTYADSGAWQGGTVVYTGTGTSYTAAQDAGTSYGYLVWAENGDGSGASPQSNTVMVEVASTPTLTITGATTATVSWPGVAYMGTTGVACNVQGSGDWFYPPEATNGATSVSVTGLSPNTDYLCATFAVSANQGIPWWQGDSQSALYTDAETPVDLTASTSSGGVTYPDQPLSWNSDGNPSGTTYVLDQNGSQVYSGTGTSFTASQSVGGSYTYVVYAANGNGALSAASNSAVTQVASAPTLTTTGATTATVSWTAVSGATNTEVTCGEVGSSSWTDEGGTGGDALSVSGLSPDTEYQCFTAITASNQGIQWEIYSGEEYTDAAAPTNLTASTNSSGVTYPDQPLSWDSGGNQAGTTYLVEQRISEGGWVVGGNASRASSMGLPPPSWEVPGDGAYVWRTPHNTPSVYSFNGYTQKLVDFVFGANTSGAGYMFRLDTRGASTPSGFAQTSSWTSWGAPGSGFVAPADTWIHVTLTVSGSTVTADATWQGGSGSASLSGYSPQGNAYGFLGDTGGSDSWMEMGGPVYSGTGMSATATQAAGGGSYTYVVYASNSGGVLSPASNSVVTQVASAPTLTITGATTATVSWNAVQDVTTTAAACRVEGTSAWFYPSPATNGGTSISFAGMSPNTDYYCAVYAVSTNQGIEWWQGDPQGALYTDAAIPAAGEDTATQTTLTATWGADGNPSGTEYQAVLDENGSDWWQSITTTNTSYTFSGITPGEPAWVYVMALRTGNSITTNGEPAVPGNSEWVTNPTVTAVPDSPTALTGADGGLGWVPSGGRGYVNLSWSAVPGATGYDVEVYDGAQYEVFPVTGDATHWSSQQALIYPPDSSLYPNVAEGSATPPVFNHDQAGLNLRDLPQDLYCTTASSGSGQCGGSDAENYWFTVSAYNGSGNSVTYEVPGTSAPSGDYYEPTLPLQTDPNAPTITNFSLNGGGQYTYAQSVPWAMSATESPSGIAAYAMSPDGVTWTTTGVSGCTVGQVAACGGTLSASGTWQLSVGPGLKTVYVKVESTAGVWSPVQAAHVYVMADTTKPIVNATIDGGAATTNSTSATLAVTVSDPVAQAAGLTFESRYSVDGGQTWSAWASEGSSTAWTADVTLPGGASGSRTVTVQVQDSDDNLGQGSASIEYVNPSGVQPGTASGMATRGFYALPSGYQGGATGVAAFVRGVAYAAGGAAANGVVYSDPNYPYGFEAATPTSIAQALGWPTETASQLATWMSARIADNTAAGSVAVLAQGVAPDTIVQTLSTNVLMIQYMQAGGTVVWSGDVPMYYQGHSNGSATTWGGAGMVYIFGMEGNNSSYWSSGDSYTITPAGAGVGLTDSQNSGRSIPPNQPGVVDLATDTNGGWAAWFKPYSTLTPCASTIGIPVGTQCTTQPAVTVALSPPSGEITMRASLNGATWGPWQPVASSLPVTLGHTGLNTVWVQYRDSSGNQSAAALYDPGYFLYDPGPPTISASWQGGAAATSSSGAAVLTLQATDPVGTIGMTVVVTENGSTLYSGTYAADLPLTLTGSGYETVQVTVTDIAGNTAATSAGIYVQ